MPDAYGDCRTSRNAQFRRITAANFAAGQRLVSGMTEADDIMPRRTRRHCRRIFRNTYDTARRYGDGDSDEAYYATAGKSH